mgnify:CR=1 FL=1
MAKSIVVFEFKGHPNSAEEANEVINRVKGLDFNKEYYSLVIFGCEKTTVKLLTKGRNTKTITNKIAKQWQSINI